MLWSKDAGGERMTDREKAIATLTEHLDHWKRLLSEGICTKDDGERTIYALTVAIKALEQESVLDMIRADIEELRYGQPFRKYVVDECLEIIDKYKAD